MTEPAGLSAPAALVRRADPDRFLTALFAPAERRETLLVLYAFNHELARASEVASEPLLAQIRLQWWREIVEGTRRRHEIAGPLGAALDAGALHPRDLAALIDARDAETDPAFATLPEWLDHVRATAGGLAGAAGRALGASDAVQERLRTLGAAYGVAGHLRSVAVNARLGRCLLPLDVLAAHGLSADAVVANPADPRLRAALTALAGHGSALLRAAGGRISRRWIAAALPAVLARRDLARIGQPHVPRGLPDKAAVLAAYLSGRV